jgi:hypothetical protein
VRDPAARVGGARPRALQVVCRAEIARPNEFFNAAGYPQDRRHRLRQGRVGKTWLAISLSHALTTQGRLQGKAGASRCSTAISDSPTSTFGAASARARSRQRADRPIPDPPGGAPDRRRLRRAPRPPRLGSARPDDAPLLERLLADLSVVAERYDLTLLDLPAGIDHAVRRLLLAAAASWTCSAGRRGSIW